MRTQGRGEVRSHASSPLLAVTVQWMEPLQLDSGPRILTRRLATAAHSHQQEQRKFPPSSEPKHGRAPTAFAPRAPRSQCAYFYPSLCLIHSTSLSMSPPTALWIDYVGCRYINFLSCLCHGCGLSSYITYQPVCTYLNFPKRREVGCIFFLFLPPYHLHCSPG